MSYTPITLVSYVFDGKPETPWTVPFGYLSRSHVEVLLGLDPATGAYTSKLPASSYRWASANALQILSGINSGEDFAIRRRTPTDQLLVRWQDGSVLVANDLDTSDLQVLYVCQEFIDASRLSGEVSNSAALAAQAAVAAAQAAAAAATTATTTADNAEALAQQAVTTAQAASTKADQAKSDAAAALTTSAGAANTANTALTAANTANTTAGTAVSTANSANSKANAALAAISQVAVFTPVPNVAAIPAGSANARVEVLDSTGIESFSPLVGMPAGFRGDSALAVRLAYGSTGTNAWVWQSYRAIDAEARYANRAKTEQEQAAQDADRAAIKADGWVATKRLADGAVTTDKLDDEAVITAKLANGAVSTPKLANSAVSTNKLQDGSVTTPKLSTELQQQLADLAEGVGPAITARLDAIEAPGWVTQDRIGNNILTPQLASVNGGAFSGFRNRIINGSFRIAQRGITFSPVLSTDYTLDRWRWQSVGPHTVVIRQDALNLPPTRLSPFSLLVNVTGGNASVAATHAAFLEQFIEGFAIRDLIGVPLAAGFWVNSPKAGIHSLALTNGDGSRNYVRSYIVDVAHTWEYKTVLFPLGLTTDGAWNYTNGRGARLMFTLMAGSAYFMTPDSWQAGAGYAVSGQVNCMESPASFRLADVQLVPGNVVPPFEMMPIALELINCQRYYYTPQDSGRRLMKHALNGANGTSLIGPTHFFPTEMRARPTLFFTDVVGNANRWTVGSTNNLTHAIGGIGVSKGSIRMDLDFGNQGANNFGSAEARNFSVDAEL